LGGEQPSGGDADALAADAGRDDANDHRARKSPPPQPSTGHRSAAPPAARTAPHAGGHHAVSHQEPAHNQPSRRSSSADTVGPQNDPQAAASNLGIEQSRARVVHHTPDHNSKTFQQGRSAAAEGPIRRIKSQMTAVSARKVTLCHWFVTLGSNCIWGCEDFTAPVLDLNAPRPGATRPRAVPPGRGLHSNSPRG